MYFPTTLKTLTVLLLFFALTHGLSAQGDCAANRAVLDKMDQLFTAQDVDGYAEIYHAEAVRHTPEGVTKGLPAIQEAARQFFSQVEEPQGKNLDYICDGDKMAVRWEGSGTSMGKKVSVTGITIYHFEDGKIIEEWEEINGLEMMMQMGFELKPPMESKN